MHPIPVSMLAAQVMALAIIVGGVLMFPTARRLGKYLDIMIEERRNRGNPPKDVVMLAEELERTRDELARVSERQAFVEALLAGRADTLLTAGSGADDPAL